MHHRSVFESDVSRHVDDYPDAVIFLSKEAISDLIHSRDQLSPLEEPFI